MELLAVMSIMAMLTTLAVTSYFTAIRGMARRSAIKHVVNSLILARQRSCMEGVRVSVMFFNEFRGYEKDADGKQTAKEINIPSYVVCKELGRFSYVVGSGNAIKVGDEFAELGKMFGTNDMGSAYQGQLRLYNLTHGGWLDVKPWVSTDTERFDVLCSFPYEKAVTGSDPEQRQMSGFGFTVVRNQSGTVGTRTGDSYGIEAAPVGSLPKEFVFNGLDNKDSDPICINFLSTGKLDTTTQGKSSVTIIEVRDKKNPHSNTISVKESDGSIDYKETWN